MEFTQENFEKLLKQTEEIENYKKAVKEERERRKQAQEDNDSYKSQLEELQAFKKDLEEKEAKKKGKYEDLIVEKDNKIKELTDKFASLESKAGKYDEFLTKSLEDKFTKIPQEKQEFVNKVLEGKSHEERLSLLDGFIGEYTKPADFSTKPKDDGSDHKGVSKYEEAKKAGDIKGLIANAPVIE